MLLARLTQPEVTRWRSLRESGRCNTYYVTEVTSRLSVFRSLHAVLSAVSGDLRRLLSLARTPHLLLSLCTQSKDQTGDEIDADVTNDSCKQFGCIASECDE